LVQTFNQIGSNLQQDWFKPSTKLVQTFNKIGQTFNKIGSNLQPNWFDPGFCSVWRPTKLVQTFNKIGSNLYVVAFGGQQDWFKLPTKLV
jgi:hypothetical protein